MAQAEAWPCSTGHYVVAEGGSLFTWIVPAGAAPGTGFRLLGAHTDSPALRVKPRPDTGQGAAVRQLGVEVYGGPLLDSWLDRDLGLRPGWWCAHPDMPGAAGAAGSPAPAAGPAAAAIHLDPACTTAWKLDAQQHVVPIWALGDPDPGGFARFLAKELAVSPEDVMSHDVVTYDVCGSTLAEPMRSSSSWAARMSLACSRA